MRQSGLADVLQSVPSEMVYLGVSAGSIAATSTFAETYLEPRRGSGEALSTEDIVFDTPDGELRMILVKAQGVGLVAAHRRLSLLYCALAATGSPRRQEFFTPALQVRRAHRASQPPRQSRPRHGHAAPPRLTRAHAAALTLPAPRSRVTR
jgi:hypothetical protein